MTKYSDKVRRCFSWRYGVTGCNKEKQLTQIA